MMRKILTLFGISALLLAAFLSTNGSAYAATPSSNPAMNFTTMQKTCAVIQIHLSGYTHTTTCRKSRIQNSSKIIPLINRDNNCYTPNDSLEIYNYNWTSLLCFEGTGYMGVAIYKVNEVDDVDMSMTNGAHPDWFRYYDAHGGHYLGQNPGDIDGFGPTGVYVTQLCIGSNVGGHC